MKLDKTGNEDFGKTLAKIEEAINANAGGGISLATLTVTSPNATDLASTQTLANELKTKFNLLVSRLQAAQDAE